MLTMPLLDDIEQWRLIAHLYSQRLFRFPAYDLGIIKVNRPWVFNNFVNKIPYATLDQDFDGVCVGTAVKTTKSWSRDRYLYAANFQLTSRLDCEHQLLRSCTNYYCTDYDVSMSSSREIEGGGLICHDTGDPAEDKELGILVGVSSLININLPSLHNRVGPFHDWITGDCYEAKLNLHLLMICAAGLILYL
ncbi:uncharacterized protein LOC112048322 [Bicyclus anynana]|uniref:Uncharacterized protein LOC112048322 n=1 Tax=Bicyclus anynana TaxID=110368 RepID=A0A6J1N3W3_BICAN|nr:uncharacterized protein LOC112048322 [Bicyclus anynana]